MEKLDILAIAAHPDDIELCCGGTIIKHTDMGLKVGIVDLTAGELGTRGTPEQRLQEAANAAKKMGVAVRLNAGMADGFFTNDEAHLRQLIAYIRHFCPDMVIANAVEDRHPDHGRAGKLIADACFYAGLRKIPTQWQGEEQAAWRPKRVFHMIQDRLMEPSFIVDTTAEQERKMEAIKCYESQFHNPKSDEPVTYIATSNFLTQITARDEILGKRIGVRYGEGFVCENILGINSFKDLLLPEIA
jgi:N-acetylglucosamine malate deacetylase 1